MICTKSEIESHLLTASSLSDITIFSARIVFLHACYDMKLYNNASRIFGKNNFPSNHIQNRRDVAELLAEE